MSKLVFKCPDLGSAGCLTVRLSQEAYDTILTIATKCRLPMTQVASLMILHARQDVEFEEVPLYNLKMRKSE